jgi:hypothetical protein
MESLMHGDLNGKNFTNNLAEAAERCLSIETKPRRKDYLSHTTWALSNDRQRLFTQGLDDGVKALDRQIKKEARADRRRHAINQFHHAPGDPYRKKTWKVTFGRLSTNLDPISSHHMLPCVIPTVEWFLTRKSRNHSAIGGGGVRMIGQTGSTPST